MRFLTDENIICLLLIELICWYKVRQAIKGVNLAIYENPSNGYQEEVTWRCNVAVFFFGAIYLIIEGFWLHAILYTILAVVLFSLGGFPMLIVPIVYAFNIQGMLRTRYLRKGWRDVTPSKGKK